MFIYFRDVEVHLHSADCRQILHLRINFKTGFFMLNAISVSIHTMHKQINARKALE
jgi:hypothetical protein